MVMHTTFLGPGRSVRAAALAVADPAHRGRAASMPGREHVDRAAWERERGIAAPWQRFPANLKVS